jgi:hypothetical protein
MIPKYKPEIKIFPSYFFIPEHYSVKSKTYNGGEKIYANHVWGSTGGGKNYRLGI